MLQRATTYYDQQHWEQSALWVKYLSRHFDEIRLEIHDESAFVRQKMQRHLVAYFPIYVQSSLIFGNAHFYQEKFDSAAHVFTNIYQGLEQFRQDYNGQKRNAQVLTIANNLAACHQKLKRNEEAVHLLKTLSTAPGNFGQIINHNLQACAA